MKRRVTSGDVNSYLGDHAGNGVTAKTFRTWNATVRAAEGLASVGERLDTPTARALNHVIEAVAGHLGNARAVCRDSYVHPAVVESSIAGSLPAAWRRPVGAKPAGLTVIERKTLRLLRQATAS